MKNMLMAFVLMACRNEVDKTQAVEDVEPVVVDADGDGFSEEDGDCDDRDAQISPNAVEICDGFDNNCDGEIDEGVTQTFFADADEDGFGDPENNIEACDVIEGYVVGGNDCDDDNDSVYPSAEELCDGLDNDCDDTIDEDVGDLFYIDADGDGVGDSEQPITQCEPDLGLSSVGGDCDDSDPTRSPNAFEICDEIDNDCDGDVDEGVTTTFYYDGDEDGFGDLQSSIEACTQAENYVTNSDDCDDINTLINPLADEICDDEDNDCDGFNNEAGAIGELVWYQDGDGDGFGQVGSTMSACDQPAGYVDNYDDCDDAEAQVSPNAIELCDAIDNNCDGTINEPGAVGEQTFYADGDADGFGDPNNSVTSCTQPLNYIIDDTDCNDGDNTEYPGVMWYADSDSDTYGDPNNSSTCSRNISTDVLDNTDCDDGDNTEYPGVVWYADSDGDTYGDPNNSATCSRNSSTDVQDSSDCDDTDAAENPTAVWYTDADSDGFGNPNNSSTCSRAFSSDVLDNTDCNDVDASEYPGVTWYADADSDGFGNPSSMNSCSRNASTDVNDNTDCDDGDAAENPTAVWYTDADSDGFGNPNNSSTCSRAFSSDVFDNTDCDDLDNSEYPGVVWYADSDGDTYGDPNNSATCSRGSSTDVLDNTDCDDADAGENPTVTWYADSDADSYGNPSNFSNCSRNASTDVLDNTDCDDVDSGEYPGVVWYADSDGDTYGDPNNSSTCSRAFSSDVLDNTDCDDTDVDEQPGAVWYPDSDGDGFGDSVSSSTCSRSIATDVLDNTDCNDNDENFYPGASEACSGEDRDCDLVLPEPCSSCLEIKEVNADTVGDGIYTIDTTWAGTIDAYCDMTTDGGGWTLVQRTVWDFAESSTLLTNFSSFYSSISGTPQPNDAYRLSGPLWSELNVELDHMLVHTARDSSSGVDCSPLYYIGTDGAFALSSSSLSVTTSTFSSSVGFFSDASFDAQGMGFNCTSGYNAVPWFYTSCCTTCPTFAGSYYSPARPMASYIDSTADLYGNTGASVCPSGAAVSSLGYEAMNSMEYYLR